MKKIIKNKHAVYLIFLFTIIFVLKIFYLNNIISLLLLISISVSLNLAVLLLVYIFRKKINNTYIIITFVIVAIYNTVDMVTVIYPPKNLIGNSISFILFILFLLSFYKANNTK